MEKKQLKSIKEYYKKLSECYKKNYGNNKLILKYLKVPYEKENSLKSLAYKYYSGIIKGNKDQIIINYIYKNYDYKNEDYYDEKILSSLKTFEKYLEYFKRREKVIKKVLELCKKKF